MVETFYKAQLAGEDVRLALHQARVALYQSQREDRSRLGQPGRLRAAARRLCRSPADVRLQSVLASLKTMQGWSDKLVEQGDKDPALFDRCSTAVAGTHRGARALPEDAEQAGRSGMLGENLGLLGSAEKRLAELCFVRSKLGEAARWQQSMREALGRSRDWYRQSAEKNLSHHWTGVQYLSLEAILDGRIANPGRWYAASTAAELDLGKPKPSEASGRWDRWPSSTCLRRSPVRTHLPAQPRKALAEMKARVRVEAGGDTFPLESTERQLRRYVDWWTAANGFFPGTSDLAARRGACCRSCAVDTTSAVKLFRNRVPGLSSWRPPRSTPIENLVYLTFLQVIAVSVLDAQCETRFVSWLCHRR